MSSEEATRGWYVRARGRVLGPMTWAQLQSLRDRGQLARFDEVSQDRQSWTAAGRVPRLFAQGEASSGRAPSPARSSGLNDYIVLSEDDVDHDAITAGPPIEGDAEWYFARDRTQQGPVRLSQLQRMADAGEIGPDTLVWRDGLAHWTRGSAVEELRFPIRLDAIAAAQADVRTAPSASVTLPPRQARDAVQPTNPPHRTSILAINSLILGGFWLFGLGSLAAIVLGVIAMRQIARSQGTLTGRRLAIAAIILGIAGLGLTLGLLLSPRSPA